MHCASVQQARERFESPSQTVLSPAECHVHVLVLLVYAVTFVVQGRWYAPLGGLPRFPRPRRDAGRPHAAPRPGVKENKTKTTTKAKTKTKTQDQDQDEDRSRKRGDGDGRASQNAAHSQWVARFDCLSVGRRLCSAWWSPSRVCPRPRRLRFVPKYRQGCGSSLRYCEKLILVRAPRKATHASPPV
jgi:hypothetical protein